MTPKEELSVTFLTLCLMLIVSHSHRERVFSIFDTIKEDVFSSSSSFCCVPSLGEYLGLSRWPIFLGKEEKFHPLNCCDTDIEKMQV